MQCKLHSGWRGVTVSSTMISPRTDTELKKQAEKVLSDLGMTLNGTFNMLLHQIVREEAVPLSLSLSSKNALYADLLVAEEERSYVYVGKSGEDVLKEMDELIAVVDCRQDCPL